MSYRRIILCDPDFFGKDKIHATIVAMITKKLAEAPERERKRGKGHGKTVEEQCNVAEVRYMIYVKYGDDRDYITGIRRAKIQR